LVIYRTQALVDQGLEGHPPELLASVITETEGNSLVDKLGAGWLASPAPNAEGVSIVEKIDSELRHDQPIRILVGRLGNLYRQEWLRGEDESLKERVPSPLRNAFSRAETLKLEKALPWTPASFSIEIMRWFGKQVAGACPWDEKIADTLPAGRKLIARELAGGRWAAFVEWNNRCPYVQTSEGLWRIAMRPHLPFEREWANAMPE